MKKVGIFFFFALILVMYGFSQNNLTQDQIRRHANELGVSYEALQRLVDSHRVQTGLSNPNANRAQVLSSINELEFMRESDMLVIGSYYRVRARFFSQSGRSVHLTNLPNENMLSIFPEVGFLVNNIRQNTIVDVLIGVRARQWGGQELLIVEIAIAR